MAWLSWRNGYQMKSTAIFLGVNVAASIPLVLCPQANAQGENQMSGTADFLKSTLAKTSDTATAKSMMAGEPTFSAARREIKIKRDLTPSETLGSQRAIATRQAVTSVGGVKLRPFIPGRKLPSKADLESNFSAMAPQFDNSVGQSNLTANVSETNYLAPAGQEYQAPGYGNYRPGDARSQNRARLKDAARVASGYDRRSASRALPGQSPSTPGQVGFPCAQQAVANMNPVRSAAPRNADEWAAQMNGANGAAEVPVQNRTVANDLGAAPSGGTAGPAPFPLNLLPEASLKQFIGSTAAGGKRAGAAAAPSYFGSWKGNAAGGAVGAGQLASAQAAKPALQPSGFRTYLAGGKNGQAQSQLHTQTASAFHTYTPMAMSNRQAAPGHIEAPKHLAQNVQPSTTVQVATYGSYKSNVTF